MTDQITACVTAFLQNWPMVWEVLDGPFKKIARIRTLLTWVSFDNHETSTPGKVLNDSAAVVAQLAENLLQTSEDLRLNPAISKFLAVVAIANVVQHGFLAYLKPWVVCCLIDEKKDDNMLHWR